MLSPVNQVEYMETSVNVYKVDVTIYQYYYQRVKTLSLASDE